MPNLRTDTNLAQLTMRFLDIRNNVHDEVPSHTTPADLSTAAAADDANCPSEPFTSEQWQCDAIVPKPEPALPKYTDEDLIKEDPHAEMEDVGTKAVVGEAEIETTPKPKPKLRATRNSKQESDLPAKKKRLRGDCTSVQLAQK